MIGRWPQNHSSHLRTTAHGRFILSWFFLVLEMVAVDVNRFVLGLFLCMLASFTVFGECKNEQMDHVQKRDRFHAQKRGAAPSLSPTLIALSLSLFLSHVYVFSLSLFFFIFLSFLLSGTLCCIGGFLPSISRAMMLESCILCSIAPLVMAGGEASAYVASRCLVFAFASYPFDLRFQSHLYLGKIEGTGAVSII